MADKPPKPNDFETRLHAANARRPDRKSERDASKQGIGFAFRIGTELVSALIVGVGIGLLLDYWLDTKPWLLLVFFILGSAAGVLNVFRAVGGYGYAAGYRQPRSATQEDEAGSRTGTAPPDNSGDR